MYMCFFCLCFKTNHVQIHVNIIAEYFLLKTVVNQTVSKTWFEITGVIDVINYLVKHGE